MIGILGLATLISENDFEFIQGKDDPTQEST